ncbi:MAG: DEAD/DEAH box helicase [Gammaproteobacteria bacterium]|jgi:superfamily II DNA or RNA helicase|nr:DEAD/DEAH box helicase [Gammaproteobacteria bacterium]MBT5235836.1 DEAD/DEAH box helicase [Candidatus Neomarinimicrobiota bacterium]MBT3490392.1 DEAD/DEAH box helicase [Gammaproteobacteria bacterium]MBT3718142.1 DEAD/DEAH box helicase [Gammaproteobacteria bacterium]MBT3845544.1 DEAD/DEAH box helicase [Gammaproteobacteria bacterium]
MKLTITGNLTLENLTNPESGFLKSENEWPNPQIKIAENMGRYSAHLPPLVEVWSEEEGKLILPRGYLDQLLEQFTPATIQDLRTVAPVDMPQIEGVTYRGYQQELLDRAYRHEQGTLVSPTGSGKSLMGMALIAHHGQRSLILVNSKELASQWKQEIKKWMGIEAGTVGGGKWVEGEEITVVMLQTLHRNTQKAVELFSRHGLTLVDETHRIAAQTFSEVIGWSSTLYRYGLTATPHRRDGLHDLIHRSVGDVIATIHPDQVEQQGGIVPATVKVIQTGFTPSWAVDSWSEYITELVESADRNLLIAIIASQASESAPTLILTERVDHVGYIAANLDGALEIHGKLPAKERRSRIERIAEHQITIGTTGLLGEGLDVSGWGVLIMATPISSKVRLLQAIGRVIRPHPGKQRGYIADLVDDHGFSGSSRNKRLSIYEERGFDVVR